MATMPSSPSSDVCSKEGDNHAHKDDRAALHDNDDSDLIYDPLLKYLHHESSSNNTNNNDISATQPSEDSSTKPSSSSFNIYEAISNLQTQGYHIIPSILSINECNNAMDQLWEFVSDVSGGVICRDDPSSWFDHEDVLLFVDGVGVATTTTSLVMSNDANDGTCAANGSTVANNSKSEDSEDDTDPWPYTDNNSSNNNSNDRFQSLGSGILLSHIHELLACRVFTPLFGNETKLLCSKEGFSFSRPKIVEHLGKEEAEEEEEGEGNGSGTSSSRRSCHLVWNKQHRGGRRKNDGNEVAVKEGQQYYYAQGVPPRAVVNRSSSSNLSNSTTTATTSKKQYNKQQKLRNKQQCYKDITGLCHIQASVSFTDQTIDRDNNGGYFACYPYSHSNVHRELLGVRMTQGSTQIPLTNDEIMKLRKVYGCNEERIYAKKGDVILWRSDLVHAEVAPSLTKTTRYHDDDGYDNDEGDDECGGDNIGNYKGSREFRAVAYCSMLPVEAVKEYNLYSIPKHKVNKRKKQQQQQQQQQSSTACIDDIEKEMMDIKYKELMDQKLEAYRCGKTGNHRPELEVWYPHRRVTMWNAHLSGDGCNGANIYDDVRMIPPRLLQRPKFRLGPPKLTVRQAELYGLLPYQKESAVRGDNVHNNKEQEKARRDEIERAVSRGVRFVEGVYKTKDMEAVGPWTVRDGKFTDEWGLDTTSYNFIRKQIPICQANMEVLTPCTENGIPVGLSGQDKYLGGMASPCGRYIYGVPGHAKQVVQVDVNTRKVEMIGPEYHGEFKWLRGVEIPADDMGKNEDGNYAYPSGCCLALPCNSEEGCVLKVDPATASVTTFMTEPIPNGAETGWLYHGGSLAGGYVYAIPASASRVMKIDPRLETTTYIGPEFDGIKAKWYGGLLMADGCIYGIPHNATGVLKIDPRSDEVSVLAEGTLPEGRWKWHGGLASSDGKKFIGFPNNEDSILVFDVVKQKVYTVGDSTVLRSGYHRVPQDGGYKYLGGSLTLDGKFAYLFPCDAEYVLKFDMETDECQLVGPHLTEGENKFQNGFVGRDGSIYGCPQRASGVLRIIPPGVARYDRNGCPLPDDEEYVDVMYCGDDMVGCKDKMEGGVLGMDGTIFNIPLRAKAFVNILPGPSPTSI